VRPRTRLPSSESEASRPALLWCREANPRARPPGAARSSRTPRLRPGHLVDGRRRHAAPLPDQDPWALRDAGDAAGAERAEQAAAALAREGCHRGVKRYPSGPCPACRCARSIGSRSCDDRPHEEGANHVLDHQHAPRRDKASGLTARRRDRPRRRRCPASTARAPARGARDGVAAQAPSALALAAVLGRDDPPLMRSLSARRARPRAARHTRGGRPKCRTRATRSIGGAMAELQPWGGEVKLPRLLRWLLRRPASSDTPERCARHLSPFGWLAIGGATVRSTRARPSSPGRTSPAVSDASQPTSA
jgi:hypothetical protein